MTSTMAYLFYMVFAIGGAGLYFLMPRPGESKARIGAVFAIAALAGLIAVFVGALPAGHSAAPFCLFAVIAIASGARVVTHPKPVYSALYFVLVVIAVAALLILLDAEFAAIALIIVYAGAILVTYLFVIMLAQQSGSPVYDRRAREPFLAVLTGFVLMAAIAGRVAQLPVDPNPAASAVTASADQGFAPSTTASNTLAIGRIIMTRYVVALEISAVLLLISMIGAIAMSRKRVPVDGHAIPQEPLGQVGREVPPF